MTMNRMRIAVCAVCAALTGFALAAECTFTGAVNGNWNEAGNWSGGVKPTAGDSVVMTSAQGTIVNNIGELALSGLTYNGTVPVTSFSGSTITLQKGAALSNQSSQRFQVKLNLVLEEGVHTLFCNMRIDLNGIITGPGGFEKTGSNMVAISGDNSFTGGFTATAGDVYYTGKGTSLGTGKATFAKGTKLYLYSADITASTPLEFAGEVNNAGNIMVQYSMTIGADVTLAADGQTRIKTIGGGTDKTLRFNGTVTYEGSGNAIVNNMGNDPTSGLIFGKAVNWPNGGLYQEHTCFTKFEAPGNYWSKLDLVKGDVYLCANALADGVDIKFAYDNTRYFLGGNVNVRRLMTGAVTGNSIETTAPSVLTVKENLDDTFAGALNGDLSVVYAPPEAKTWTLTQGGSMNGALTVSAGNLILDGAQLPNVSSLVVAENATITAQNDAAVNARLGTLEIPSEAAFVGFAGKSFRVDHLIIGGVEQMDGVTHTVAGATVEVALRPGPGTEFVWNAGAGSDTSFGTDLNWQGGKAPQFGPKTLPRFTAGSAATGTEATDFAGFKFDVANDFTIGGAFPLSLYWSGLSFTDAFAGRTAEIAAPVKLAGDQEWNVPAGVTLKISGDILKATDASTVLITGAGGVTFAGANASAGAFVVSNGDVVVTHDDGLDRASPAGAMSIRRTDETKLTSSLTLGSTSLGGVTFARDLHLESPDDGVAHCILVSAQKATNTVTGKVTVDDAAIKRVLVHGSSQITFAGGISSPNADFFLYGEGSTVVAETPVDVKRFYCGKNAKLHLAVGGNAIAGLSSEGNAIFSVEADDVFSGTTRPTVILGNGDTLVLNGHDVAFGNTSGGAGGIVTSDEPATVSIDQPTGGNFDAAFQGPVSVSKTGAKTLSLTGKSTSSGTLESAGGLLGVYGTWKGDFRAKGGIIRFQPGAKAGGSRSTIRVENNGKIGLNDGVVIRVGRLVVNGVEMPTGTYGSSNSAAEHKDDSVFETVTAGVASKDGTGILQVGGTGLMLILR